MDKNQSANQVYEAQNAEQTPIKYNKDTHNLAASSNRQQPNNDYAANYAQAPQQMNVIAMNPNNNYNNNMQMQGGFNQGMGINMGMGMQQNRKLYF